MRLCPVRDCHQPLLRQGRQWVCPRSHSFDIARSGYLNLLQPQDRRSREPGDSRAVVAARRRLHDRGLTLPLLAGISDLLAPSAADTILDAGCGEGSYLGSLARASGFSAHGVDISVPAIDSAARRYHDCEWTVANADRWLPFADRSFSAVLSLTARMNPGEFHRVLQDDGRLLVGLPAPNDLIELRGVESSGEGRDRVPRTVADFASHFRLAARRRTASSADLDADAVADVLVSIYRPLAMKPVTARRVTFALDLLLFEVLANER